MASSVSFKGEKLVGKSNYIDWVRESEIYLRVNGYMPYIDGTLSEPNKRLYCIGSDATLFKSDEFALRYQDKLDDFMTKNVRSLAAIQGTISPNNIKRFSHISSAKDLWNSIKRDFGDSSIDTVSRYYTRFNLAKYSNYDTIDEYIGEIQTSARALEELEYAIPPLIVLVTIYNGLPSSFDSFISRKYKEIGSTIKSKLNVDKLISDLIAEDARITSLEANNVGGTGI